MGRQGEHWLRRHQRGVYRRRTSWCAWCSVVSPTQLPASGNVLTFNSSGDDELELSLVAHEP